MSRHHHALDRQRLDIERLRVEGYAVRSMPLADIRRMLRE